VELTLKSPDPTLSDRVTFSLPWLQFVMESHMAFRACQVYMFAAELGLYVIEIFFFFKLTVPCIVIQC